MLYIQCILQFSSVMWNSRLNPLNQSKWITVLITVIYSYTPPDHTSWADIMATLTLAFNLSNYMQHGAVAFLCVGFFPKTCYEKHLHLQLFIKCQMLSFKAIYEWGMSRHERLNTIAFPVGLLFGKEYLLLHQVNAFHSDASVKRSFTTFCHSKTGLFSVLWNGESERVWRVHEGQKHLSVSLQRVRKTRCLPVWIFWGGECFCCLSVIVWDSDVRVFSAFICAAYAQLWPVFCCAGTVEVSEHLLV